MLFLVSSTKIISLSTAAKVLNGFQNNEGGAQIKTQIRRLYDIANVLSSIGLIEKETHISQNGRKPVFKYIGPHLNEDLDDSNKNEFRLPEKNPKMKTSRSLVRHSSFQEICAVAEIEHKKLCYSEGHNSAPPFDKSKSSTPHKTDFSSLAADLELHNSKDTKPDSPYAGESTVLGKNSVSNLANMKPPPLKILNIPVQLFAVDGTYYIYNPIDNKVSQVISVPVEPVVQIDSKSISEVPVHQGKKSHNIKIAKSSDQVLLNHQTTIDFIANPYVKKISPKAKESLGKIHFKYTSEPTSCDSGFGSTRNTSPCSFNDSPVSSRQTTPVPFDENNFINKPGLHKRISIKDKTGLLNKKCSPEFIGKSVDLPIPKKLNNSSVNSCSGESLNLEISEIFKNKALNCGTAELKPFLIDEKTILSPIKNLKGVQTETPSPFIAPPHLISDGVFSFSSRDQQA